MYGIVLDRSSPFSLVRQLCESLRTRILDGSVTAGSRLPSSRILAAELGVARNVVTDAYEQLEAEGYLTGIVGSGTTVTTLGAKMSGRRASSARSIGAGGVAAGRPGASPAGAPRPGGAQPGGLVDFASACGIPDLASFPYRTWRRCAVEALDSALPADLSFADIRGASGLRTEIASLLFRTRGIACSPDQVFITRGATHALSLVCRFLRPRTDIAVLEDPLLNSIKRVVASAGLDLAYAPVDEDGLDTRALPEPRGSALLIVSPSHQFPTGGILPIARRLELLADARARKGWIFEDDYDGDIRLRGLPVPPIVTLEGERVFYSGTFNKTLFPAVRTGYLIVPEPLAERFATFRLGLSDWMETIPGKALASFIRQGHYERRVLALRRLYSRRRDRVVSGIGELFGDEASARGDEAGCHCRIHIRSGAAAGRDWRESAAAGVKIATVARYIAKPHSAARRFKDDILIGYGNLDDEEIGEGLARLGSFLKGGR